MGIKKHTTCLATLVQNELNSDVARFCLATNQVGPSNRLLFSTHFAVILQNKLHVLVACFTKA